MLHSNFEDICLHTSNLRPVAIHWFLAGGRKNKAVNRKLLIGGSQAAGAIQEYQIGES